MIRMQQEDADASRHIWSVEELSETLMAADTSVLALVHAHLTGDVRLLEMVAPFISPWQDGKNIPADVVRTVHEAIKPVLLDGSGGTWATPSPELLKKLMSVGVGETVPDEYVEMMLEQIALKPESDRDGSWREAPGVPVPQNFRVAIIGAGMSGICAAIRLRQAGVPFRIYEKNAAAGGTWWENRYPGCGVDTPNHYYSYSFEPNHEWPDYFSKRDELYRYFEKCIDKYGLRQSIEFGIEVRSTHFDERTLTWRVESTTSDGKTEVAEASAVIFAVGQLNRPSIPRIPGIETFKGPVAHTAQWPSDLDLTGMRVGMIGTGASGMQAGPALAPHTTRLVVFQRSPHWAMRTPNYHRKVEEGTKRALRHIPFYANWYRFQLFWWSSDSLHSMLQIDPTWPKLHQSLNQKNEDFRQRLIDYIRSEIGDDPELLEKVIPSFPPYGKRMLRDNDWYRMLKRPNVDLVTDPIEQVKPGSVVTRSGAEFELDALVLATGFRASEQLMPIEVTGRNGLSIHDVWRTDGPRAYLGITVPGFPNMFITFGPNTAIAHGGSMIFHTECAVRYIMNSMKELFERGCQTMECKPEVHDAYNARVDEAHSRMVWSHKGVNNWYRNSSGRVTQATPWRQVDYWKFTQSLNPDDYVWQASGAEGKQGESIEADCNFGAEE